MEKRYSQACENNKAPILAVLQAAFADLSRVLEIGSGTGQHAVYFAAGLPEIIWQPSDLTENHGSILAWQGESPRVNLLPPIRFEVGINDWPDVDADGVFTANTAHIMQPQQTREMMQLVAAHLPVHGVFCQYGPFNVDGEYTSDSNRQFDAHLRASGYGGIRDLAELESWAGALQLCEKVAMPANNFLLIWRQAGSRS